MHCKINAPKNGKILKVEINLSLLKMIYVGQFVLDLTNLISKVRVFSIEINREINN